MKFWIVTPSYNQLDYLKRCVASVADQAADGLQVHHHIQDGGSHDGTVEWLEKIEKKSGAAGYSFSFKSERDDGMYDAVNRGFALQDCQQRPDSLLAYLNCDEQYLTGTLVSAARFFKDNPEADILSGDYLIIDEDGGLLAFRKGIKFRKAYIQAAHLYNLSCSLFVRSRVWEEVGFDSRFKDAGDHNFIMCALRHCFRTRHLQRYLSVFTFATSNRSLGQVAQEEYDALREATPRSIRILRPLINASRHVEKLCRGGYRQKFPLEYSIYAGNNLTRRILFRAESSSFRWPAMQILHESN